jgi:AmmeMemoRadiSam system protein B
MKAQPSFKGSARPAAVAGKFYPADPAELRRTIEDLLAEVKTPPCSPPKALIVPHAGLIYSGPIAASAYAELKPLRKAIRKVVLIGPAHYVFVPGLAVPTSDAFETPLGSVRVSRELVDRTRTFPIVRESDEAHAPEHSLEVQLPFLQVVLKDFEVLPMLAGQVTPEEIAEVLDAVWGGPETCLIISSDLSHFLAWAAARKIDTLTAEAIEKLQPELISDHQACGRLPIKGLLKSASHHGLKSTLLDLRNSGDTAGNHDRVVGYGAFAFRPKD